MREYSFFYMVHLPNVEGLPVFGHKEFIYADSAACARNQYEDKIRPLIKDFNLSRVYVSVLSLKGAIA